MTNCGASTGRQQDICIHPLSFAHFVGPVCDSSSTTEKPEEPAEKPSLFMLRETHALPPLAIPPRPEQHAALMLHMCAVCISVCRGALVADWPECAYVSPCVVLYVSAF